MSFAKWTWVGLAFVVAGWVLIFAAALFSAPAGGFLSGYNGAGSSPLLSIIGQTAVFSGLGIVLLGILSRGVHAVEALSEELAFVRTQTTDDPAEQYAASPQAQVVAAPQAAPALATATATPPAPVSQKAPEIVSRGEISGREYVLFADGTVGVETLLGRRRFRTLGDAREFIGA